MKKLQFAQSVCYDTNEEEIEMITLGSLHKMEKTCSMEELSFSETSENTEHIILKHGVLLRRLLNQNLKKSKVKAIIHNSNRIKPSIFSPLYWNFRLIGFKHVATYKGNSDTVYTYIKTK